MIAQSLYALDSHTVKYSEKKIDRLNLTASMLDIAQFVAAEIMSGERVLLYEPVATASSWIVCGMVLRILFPSLAIPSGLAKIRWGLAKMRSTCLQLPRDKSSDKTTLRLRLSLPRFLRANTTSRSTPAALPIDLHHHGPLCVNA